MADALLAGSTNAPALFQSGGALAFTVHSNGHPRWEWNGLVEALSIQLPEKLGTEFVDALPGGAPQHWGDYAIDSAFAQSVKWRDPSAVSKRTLELANQLQSESQNILTLMIELAARPDHSWNADMLHRNLQGWKLPERDQKWTIHISTEGMYEGHPANRLIAWSETGEKDHADDEVLRLCAVALSWLLTSSAAWVRDRATKALASLFADRVELFPKILPQFAAVDDNYVTERILASAYGALIRWPCKERATAYSSAVWDCFFGKGHIPPDLLLLDYAYGILEVSSRIGELPPRVDLSKASPPYTLKAPKFNVTKQALEKIAKKAGGEQILRSCDEWGDFQRYEVASRVGGITKVPLTSPGPALTSRQKAHKFESEAIEDSRKRREALRSLQRICLDARGTRVLALDEDCGVGIETEDAAADRVWKASFEKAEKAVLKLLSKEEIERYRQEWLPSQHPDTSLDALKADPAIETWISLPASHWIAKQAYAQGWTAKRFGQDIGQQHDRDRPKIERIGKKYQWLARSELLARLVNNYWLVRNYDDGGPARYVRATDVDFERDVDPSLFNSARHVDGQKVGQRLGLLLPPPPIQPMDEAESDMPLRPIAVALRLALAEPLSCSDHLVNSNWHSHMESANVFGGARISP